MYASTQCPPCHALINFQSGYQPLNQGNSLLPGSPWLQERQIRFGHNFRRGRLCASRRVLLRETWKIPLMNGIELHCDTLISLCRAPDGSKLNGVVPVAKQCDPKETYYSRCIGDLARKSSIFPWKLLSAITVRLGTRWTAASAYTHFCTNMSERASLVIKAAASAILQETFLNTSVEIFFGHCRSPWYAMDRSSKQAHWHENAPLPPLPPPPHGRAAWQSRR